MKKIIFISLIAALFAACQSPVEEPMDDVMLKSAVKVDLCHLDEYGNYISISVSEKAVEAHMAHGDKYQYSPEGQYTIYRANCAVLEVTITPDGSGYTVVGKGTTSGGNSVYFKDAYITVEDHSFVLVLPQYDSDTDISRGTHYISGDVLQCEGIDSLVDVAQSYGVTYTSDYSLTPFENCLN